MNTQLSWHQVATLSLFVLSFHKYCASETAALKNAKRLEAQCFISLSGGDLLIIPTLSIKKTLNWYGMCTAMAN